MGKKQKKVTQQKQYKSDKVEQDKQNGLDLKSLLDANVLEKLQATAHQLKQEEELQKQKKEELEMEAKQAEQKRLENDFAYLLEHSKQPSNKYK